MLLGLDLQFPGTSQSYWEAVQNERRFNHTYVIGKTGQGKSTFLINNAIQDILNGDGVTFFDPHGDAVDEIMRHVPPEKIILFDPSDTEFPIGFNVLHNVQDVPLVASAILDTFKSIWGDSWGPQLEQYLYNGIAALAELQDGTLLGLKFLITSDKYREKVMQSVKDPIIKDFWETDFDIIMPEREQRQTTLSTLNKIGKLISDPKVRNVIGQTKSTIDLKDIMDNGKCLLVRIPQGKLGIDKSRLIGAVLMAQLHLTALSRETRKPFHIYADEAHHFGSTTLQEMLSGIRKFKVSLVLAHQYIDQLTPQLRSAVIGTVGTIVAFKLGITDAEIIAKEMELEPRDLVQQRPYKAWVKSSSIDLLTMTNIDFPVFEDSPRKIKEQTRRQYGRTRWKVENRINKFIRST